jgi:hypothetical protein
LNIAPNDEPLTSLWKILEDPDIFVSANFKTVNFPKGREWFKVEGAVQEYVIKG